MHTLLKDHADITASWREHRYQTLLAQFQQAEEPAEDESADTSEALPGPPGKRKPKPAALAQSEEPEPEPPRSPIRIGWQRGDPTVRPRVSIFGRCITSYTTSLCRSGPTTDPL
eukprot:671769-Prorocentrum_minimum.AAC.1